MEEITVYYAVAWQLLAAAAPYAIKGVGQLLGVGKPSKEDYMPDTTYMDKYIANIRSRQSGREVYHQAMQPALRTIGAQGRKMQRQIGYGVEKAGLTGSGIEAQQRLSAGKTTLTAMQEASEKATAAQISESRRLGEKADAMTLQKEAAISQGEKAFDRAETAFGQEKMATLTGLAGAAVGAGISQYGAGTEAFESAKASGVIGKDVTRASFLESAKTAGYKDPAKYSQGLSSIAESKFGMAYLPPGLSEAMNAAGIPKAQSSKIGTEIFNEELKMLREALANEEYTDEEKEKELQDFIEELKRKFGV